LGVTKHRLVPWIQRTGRGTCQPRHRVLTRKQQRRHPTTERGVCRLRSGPAYSVLFRAGARAGRNDFSLAAGFVSWPAPICGAALAVSAAEAVPIAGGNEPPIRAAIPVLLAALRLPIRGLIPISLDSRSAPGSQPDSDPIGRPLQCRLGRRLGARKRGEWGAESVARGRRIGARGGRSGAGFAGMRCGSGESQNRAMLRMGSIGSAGGPL
jgi:hypothetical protein